MMTSLVLSMLLSAPVVDVESGVAVGGRMAAFDPTHVAGPDKGTNTCPT